MLRQACVCVQSCMDGGDKVDETSRREEGGESVDVMTLK